MDIQNALKILSDVLGFDCSSFSEVMENGILQDFFTSEEDAKVAAKKINALAELLGYEDNTFKAYKRKGYKRKDTGNDNYYEVLSNNETIGSWFERHYTPVE